LYFYYISHHEVDERNIGFKMSNVFCLFVCKFWPLTTRLNISIYRTAFWIYLYCDMVECRVLGWGYCDLDLWQQGHIVDVFITYLFLCTCICIRTWWSVIHGMGSLRSWPLTARSNNKFLHRTTLDILYVYVLGHVSYKNMVAVTLTFYHTANNWFFIALF